jgi:hypothetical protein
MKDIKLLAALLLVAGLAPAAFASSSVNIYACYACQNTGMTAIDSALTANPSVAYDGLLFAFDNTGTTAVTNAVFSVSSASPNDQFDIGTIAAGSWVIVMPGLSNDGGVHASGGLFAATGSAADTSEGAGGVNDASIFTFTGTSGALALTSGSIIPGTASLIHTYRDPGATGQTSFLGLGPNGDGCNNCYFAQIGSASATPVPLPAAGWLFGPAIAGVLGIAKRRRSANLRA